MKRQHSIFAVLVSICCVIAMMLSFSVSASASGGAGPSAADLDEIRSDIKYPNYDWMYLDEYISAEVSPRSVYCFKDPDNDIWRDGNVFIVYGGTEVTILAKSEGYACVILTGTNYAGWINDAYLSEKYSYTINSNQQRQVFSGTPGPSDLRSCNEQVQYPKAENWLPSYETKYLKTKYGVCAYLRYQPSADSEFYDYVYEKAKVTVLARENGFSLVKTNEGMAGWVTSSLLYDSYPGVVPDGQQVTNGNATSTQNDIFNETFWNLNIGQTLGSTFVAIFHNDGTFTARSYGSGMYADGTYTFQNNGTLTISFWFTGSDCPFDRNADGFISQQKYEMQVGANYYTISPFDGDISIYYSPEMFA